MSATISTSDGNARDIPSSDEDGNTESSNYSDITSICLKSGETLEDKGATHSSVNKQGEDHIKEDHSTKETQSMPSSHNDDDNFVKAEVDPSPVNLQ